MFPLAVGARVLISGFIVILLKSRADVEKSWTQDGFASQYGNLRLKYDVTEDTLTRTEVSRGAAIAPKSDERETNASLGLKLRLLDGQEVITVPTHAFVKVKLFNGPRLLRLADWFTPAGKDSHELAVGTMRRGSASKAENGEDLLPHYFHEYLKDSVHDPYRLSGGLALQISASIALTNCPIAIDAIATIVPKVQMPNQLVGILFGQSSCIDRLTFRMIPRRILLANGEEISEEFWGDIIAEEYVDVGNDIVPL
ncbi:hypothetical protein N7465_011160 [Penicillium sp. CMV-2018d]|nr:hypothetical protein N7465_011160 [Penicillium sp. CMV-2018d]